MRKTKKATQARPKATARRSQRPALHSTIDAAEWNLPVAFAADGTRMTTLREVLEAKVKTRSRKRLSAAERCDLVAERLRMQPDDFKLAVIGIGVIDKNRAIAEVKAGSRIGQVLLEIEHGVIDYLTAKTKRR
jgi:hypothetical protein